MSDKSLNPKVRVRFAPSPTGLLHVGGVRTALFNWLYARHNGGAFILRIDDTDAARSTEENLRNIVESLQWLGLKWDEGPDPENIANDIGESGPYRQSRKTDRYRQAADKMLAEGKAFHCYCSAEELDAKRQVAARLKLAPRYDGHCLNLSEEKRKKFEAEGRKPAIRFKLPEGPPVVLEDMIRGRIEFPRDMLDHFIMVRSDGKPIYNFVSAIDDADLKITHIIRGDDHLSNTPKQMLVAEALGVPFPTCAHLPQILGLDRARLSKRHGAPGVLELREEGFMKEAVLNFLVLLGWSYNDSDEIFSLDELVEKFDISRVGSGPAAFDDKKLLWMNGLYIRNASGDVAGRDLRERLKAAYDVPAARDEAYIAKVVGLLTEGLKTLNEIVPAAAFFFAEAGKLEWEDTAKKKLSEWPKGGDILGNVLKLVEDASEFTPDKLEATFRTAAPEAGFKFKDYVHPTRFAITGRIAGPSLFHLMEVLGKGVCVERLKATQSLLGNDFRE